MRPEGLSMKNSSDKIGNRTRDHPGYSAVPQPNAPPGAPSNVQYSILLILRKIFQLLKNMTLGLIEAISCYVLTSEWPE
jgi:hypothetical protein